MVALATSRAAAYRPRNHMLRASAARDRMRGSKPSRDREDSMVFALADAERSRYGVASAICPVNSSAEPISESTTGSGASLPAFRASASARRATESASVNKLDRCR
jgi:hypothetical protein